MIQRLFNIVADALDFMGRKTGFTYNEVNIIVYFFVVPFTWLALLDILFGFHYLKIAFVIFTLGFRAGCRNFRKYSDWLFDRSVDFLNYFNRFGSNYTASSVWICVAVPIVIYAVLFALILR